MKAQHWVIIGTAISGIALQMRNLHDWHAALTPDFISAAILIIGSQIAGIKSDPPDKKQP